MILVSIGVGTSVGFSFFLSDFVEVGAKDFPLDEGVQFREKVIDLIEILSSCDSTSKNEGGRRYIKK